MPQRQPIHAARPAALAGQPELLYESERTRVVRVRPAGGAGQVICKQPLGADAARRLRHELMMLERLAGVDGRAAAGRRRRRRGSIAVVDTAGRRWRARLPARGRRCAPARACAAAGGDPRGGASLRGGAQGHQSGQHRPRGATGSPTLIDFELATTFAEERPGSPTSARSPARWRTWRPSRPAAPAGRWTIAPTCMRSARRCTSWRPAGRRSATATRCSLIHDHLARLPIAPAELNLALPQGLSDIIMRLLEKEPDGAIRAPRVWRTTSPGCARPGSAARRPVRAGRARLPAAAGAALAADRTRRGDRRRSHTAFEYALQGRERGALVAGAPGVGKTALIDELRPIVTARGGWFVAGKFDQYRRDAASDAVRQALRALGRLLLAEPEAGARRRCARSSCRRSAQRRSRRGRAAGVRAAAGSAAEVPRAIRSRSSSGCARPAWSCCAPSPRRRAGGPGRRRSAVGRADPARLHRRRADRREPGRPAAGRRVPRGRGRRDASAVGHAGPVGAARRAHRCGCGSRTCRRPIWARCWPRCCACRRARRPAGGGDRRAHRRQSVRHRRAGQRAAPRGALVPGDGGWSWDARPCAATSARATWWTCCGPHRGAAGRARSCWRSWRAWAARSSSAAAAATGLPAPRRGRAAGARAGGRPAGDGARAAGWRGALPPRPGAAGRLRPPGPGRGGGPASRACPAAGGVPEFEAIAAEQYLPAAGAVHDPAECRRVAELFRAGRSHAPVWSTATAGERFLAAAIDAARQRGDRRRRAAPGCARDRAARGRSTASTASRRPTEIYARHRGPSRDPLELAEATWVQISSLTNRGRLREAVDLGLNHAADARGRVPAGDLGAEIAAAAGRAVRVAGRDPAAATTAPAAETVDPGSGWPRAHQPAQRPPSSAIRRPSCWLVLRASGCGPNTAPCAPWCPPSGTLPPDRSRFGTTTAPATRGAPRAGGGRGPRLRAGDLPARFVFAVYHRALVRAAGGSMTPACTEGLLRGGDLQFAGFTYYPPSPACSTSRRPSTAMPAEVEPGLALRRAHRQRPVRRVVPRLPAAVAGAAR